MNKDNKLILQQAETLYNAKIINENTLGNSSNLIFEVEISQKPFILRVSEYSAKKVSHIDFELNWMNYLATTLDNVVKPVKSMKNNLYEIVKAYDKSYILCMFEKAKGKIIDCGNSTEFNDDLFFNLGALMGNMHRLTMEYSGSTVKPEFEWDKTSDFWGSISNKVFDEEVHTLEKKFKSAISILPKSKETYGIIHHDIHAHNFFVDNGHIKLFDFDDCNFSWYADDMASSLYFMVQFARPFRLNDKERTEFAEHYLFTYLKGYVQMNSISEYWIDKFDLFMRSHMAGAYKFIQNCWRNETVNPHQEYLDWLKYRLKNDLPYVFIDYKKVIDNLPSVCKI